MSWSYYTLTLEPTWSHLNLPRYREAESVKAHTTELETAKYYNILGTNYFSENKHQEAIRCYKKALDILTLALKPNHPELARCHEQIGRVYSRLSDFERAINCFITAIYIVNFNIPIDHFQLAINYERLGKVHAQMEDWPKAMEFFRLSLSIRLGLANNELETAQCLRFIGCAFFSLKDYANAHSNFLSANLLLESTQPTGFGHEKYALHTQILHDLSTTLNLLGNHDGAISCQKRALYIISITKGENSLEAASIHSDLASGFLRQKNYGDAVVHLTLACQLFNRLRGPTHPDSLKVQEVLQIATLELHARPVKFNLLDNGDAHLNVGLALNNLGCFYLVNEKYDEAMEAFVKALNVLSNIYKDHSIVAEIYNNIGKVFLLKEKMALPLNILGNHFLS